MGLFRESLGQATDGQPAMSDVIAALLRECRKEQLKYKFTALNCTTEILEAFDMDHFQTINDIIKPVLDKVIDV